MSDRGMPSVVLLGLVFASGCAALIYEVLWMKELTLLFGATATASAMTLAVFFSGLALGGLVAGRYLRRVARPLQVYAWLEFGVAGSASAWFVLHDAYDSLYGILGAEIVIAALILLPPAFCIGGTLPVIAERLIQDGSRLGEIGSLVYAINTGGAVVGAYLAGFHLPISLGFDGAYKLAVGVSVAVGCVALVFDRFVEVPGIVVPREAESSAVPSERSGMGLVRAFAFASGFVTLAYEVLWTRMFSQVLQNSVYTFASILVGFLAALAVGAWLANRLIARGASILPTLALLVAGGGVAASLSAPVFVLWTDGLAYLGGGGGFTDYIFDVFLAILVVVFGPAVLLGAVFPFLLRAAAAARGSVGRRLGDLVACNTVGAVVGASCAGFVVLETVGLWGGVWSVGALYALLATGCVGLDGLRANWARAALLCIVLGATFPYQRAHLARHPGEQLIELFESNAGVTAVMRDSGGMRVRVNNWYTLGSSGSRTAEELQGHVPLAVHGTASSVFFLGLGTGITAGAAIAHPVDRIVIAELVPDVVTVSRRYFGKWNHQLLADSRVEVVRGDGRHYLRTCGERFDVIIADLFIPWRAGVGGVYTRENYTDALRALERGGIYAQWLPTYQVSIEEFGIIARTMLEVFPRVTLWRCGFEASYPSVALVGHADSTAFDPDRVARRLAAVAARRGDDPVELPMRVDELLMYYAGNMTRAASRFERFPINSDNWPIVEYLAPVTHRRARTGAAGWLTRDALIDLLAELLDATDLDRDPYAVGLDAEDLAAVRMGLERHRASLRR